MKRGRAALSGVACLLLTAACGTTVHGLGAGASGAGNASLSGPGGTSTGDGLSVASGPGAAPGSSALGTGSGSVSGGVVGTSPAAVGSPGSGGGTLPGGSTPGSTVGEGPGVSATQILVGVTYTTNGDAANAALGASSFTQGDTKADARAVIDDINAHGGVAGRRLVPVWYGYNAQSQAPKATQDEAACAAFTQDKHVLAVAGVGLSNDFSDCLTKHGVLQVESGPIIDPDKVVFAQHPDFFEVGTLSQDRMMADYVTTLQRMNYFTGWNSATGQPAPAVPVKVGIMSVDVPEWNRPLDRILLPALAHIGHPVASSDIIRVHNPNSAGEDGQTVSQIESATLKFRQDGVTHVILLDPSGAFLLFGAPVDRGQNYYPRFGINSGSGAQAVYDNHSVTAQQLNGAVGLGWLPSLDLSAAAGTKYGTSATKHCLAVMKQRAGQTFDSTNAASIALGYCDQLYLIADALNHTGASVTVPTVAAALEGLRSSYIPSLLPAAYFSPSRHDAAQLGYDLMWDNSCTCARYVGQPHVIPG